MARTTTVDYEGVHVVLAASTLADAAVRRSIQATLNDLPDEYKLEARNFAYFITQVVENDGLPMKFERLAVNPGADALHKLFTSWLQNDELVGFLIIHGINTLSTIPGPTEKKA
jgi:hypothetical protein